MNVEPVAYIRFVICHLAPGVCWTVLNNFVVSKMPHGITTLLSDIDNEMDLCLSTLEIAATVPNVKEARVIFRKRSFRECCNPKQKGIGVLQFQDCPVSNQWVFHRKGLSSSEWVTALKMSTNIVAVRNIPERTSDGTQCRKCDAGSKVCLTFWALVEIILSKWTRDINVLEACWLTHYLQLVLQGKVIA